MKTLTKTIQTP